MNKVTQVARAMQDVLTETAKQAGRESGFVQREGKLDGASFTQTLVFGWMANPEATLEEMSKAAASCGVEITPQGLDQRFSWSGAECLRQVLTTAVKQVIGSEPQALPVLDRFTSVHLLDSSGLELPDQLKRLWPGCGGSAPSGAALKLQLRLELHTGRLEGPFLQAGRDNDLGSIGQQLAVMPGALRVADLGYWSVKRFAEIGAGGGYWLSRMQAGTNLFDTAGRELDLIAWLQKQECDEVEMTVQLSAQHRLRCRLLAERVPHEVSAQRRRKLQITSWKQGKTPSQKQLEMCDWTILVTNVPAELLSLREAQVVRRVRWQIELLFKVWKSHGRIDESRSSNPLRILCEVYAKLLALVIQHWAVLTSNFNLLERSLFKAFQTVQKYAFHLAAVLFSRRRLCAALELISRSLRAGCRKNKRRARPATFQLLASLEEEGLG
jgi:hypothetical protein